MPWLGWNPNDAPVKATVSGVFKDLKFEISEGSDQNWSCPDSALLAVSVQMNPRVYTKVCS